MALMVMCAVYPHAHTNTRTTSNLAKPSNVERLIERQGVWPNDVIQSNRKTMLCAYPYMSSIVVPFVAAKLDKHWEEATS